MTAYYNEIDPYAAEWLKNLIANNHIAPGDVDTRSIVDVSPDDVRNYTQVHLFAGIGGWSLAARLADWPDDLPLWTGSCPCQPFSDAGKRKGTTDARHLWPEMCRLVSQCRPPIVVGEQVASPSGRSWLSRVQADLEALGYATAGADLCAASVGAPHIRQRLWWMGHANGEGPCERGGESYAVAISQKRQDTQLSTRLSGLSRGNWDNSVSIDCADGKIRRIEPSIEPLAHGIPHRVGKLRAYGSAIVPQVGAVFLRACRESIADTCAPAQD